MRTIDKLIFAGKNALSNAELLSLMLGINEESACKTITYAEEIAGDFGMMEVHDFTQINGIGEAKAAAMIAGMEFCKRMQADKLVKQRLHTHQQVADLFAVETAGEKREFFMAVYLNTKMQVESKSIISIGSIDSAPVHPREVFGPAVRRGAAAVIVAHNHPSGDPTPSDEDKAVTKRLLDAAMILGIELLDHVIIGDGCSVSMKNEGYL